MAWVMVGMAAVGMISKVSEQKAKAQAADNARVAEMAGAKLSYASSESSANIMKSANREVSGNLIGEALRAGGAQSTDVKAEVDKATSMVQAANEGLTSGRSKGRQMVSLQVKGNKALQDSRTQTASVINQITDAQDKATNDINTQLIAAHQQMATILSTPGATYTGTVGEVVMAGVQGAAGGASMAGSINGGSK